jgi:hypothetical protein
MKIELGKEEGKGEDTKGREEEERNEVKTERDRDKGRRKGTRARWKRESGKIGEGLG